MKFKNCWKNKTVYIVGGGPSLQNFDWDKLKSKKVIAINKAAFKLPDAQILYFSDCSFWDKHKTEIGRHTARYKITPCMRATAKDPELLYVQPTGYQGLEKGPGIREGKNSGYAALNVAYHLGVKKIYLLGYDFQTEGDLTHWHEGYSDGPSLNVSVSKLNSYLRQFPHIAGPLKDAGIQVINTNMKSQLSDFPKEDIFPILEKVD